MPEHVVDMPVTKHQAGTYHASAPTVFFGHYWRPPESTRAPYASNLACLDYSGAHGDHPLVAYRWDHESELSAERFVVADQEVRHA